jgi:hypothetical protein
MPEGFTNRLAANWKPLLAVAELCGCADQARKGAAALSRRADDASLGVELLRDIRSIFIETETDRIRSADLLHKLISMEDRPWSQMPYTNKEITGLELAKMLKPYGVRPDQVRFGDLTAKGYMRQSFETAFRYIPDDPSPHLQNRGNTETTADFSEKRGNNLGSNVSPKMVENSQCFPVSPNRRSPEDSTQDDGSRVSPTRTDWGKDEFSCLRSGKPTLKPRGTK